VAVLTVAGEAEFIGAIAGGRQFHVTVGRTWSRSAGGRKLDGDGNGSEGRPGWDSFFRLSATATATAVDAAGSRTLRSDVQTSAVQAGYLVPRLDATATGMAGQSAIQPPASASFEDVKLGVGRVKNRLHTQRILEKMLEAGEVPLPLSKPLLGRHSVCATMSPKTRHADLNPGDTNKDDPIVGMADSKRERRTRLSLSIWSANSSNSCSPRRRRNWPDPE